MLRRSIDREPYGPAIGEKFFRSAKRVCIVFAVSALSLSALDLANIRTAESAAQFINDSRIRLADLNIADLLERIALMPDASLVTAAIPQGDSVTASRVAADPKPAAAPRAPSMRLASVDPTVLPDGSAVPPAMAISLPSMIDVLPPPAPGVPPPSPAARLHLNDKEYIRAEKCLANAIYFESRDEPERGQMAVAQVVMNRVFSGFYPNDVCSVVYQNASQHLSCQFTFACDGKRKQINERDAWARANRIAKQTLDGEIYVPEVADSTHYHAIYVRPNWVGEMKKMVRYGIHNFYRPIAWGNGADNPTWGIGPWNKKKN